MGARVVSVAVPPAYPRPPLAAGVSTREAASQLTISPKTVETHRFRIYTKLGCKNAVELTRLAVRAGLIVV